MARSRSSRLLAALCPVLFGLHQSDTGEFLVLLVTDNNGLGITAVLCA
jgi:hypothetical protein